MNEEVKVTATEATTGTEEKHEFTDETLVCVECGKEFVFSAGEQAFYKEKGYMNKPKRCRECRNAKRTAQGPSVSTTMRYATTAAERQSCLLSRPRTSPYIAVHATKRDWPKDAVARKTDHIR